MNTSRPVLNVSAPAFTLIELLIVVAIIAILAAIAVPNFLEAQMRAKVSRAKTDMRTMATGIEAYAVDTNSYALCFNYGTSPPTVGSSLWVQYSVRRLTTPVAYLSSIPGDPFVPAAQLNYDQIPGNIPERPSFIFQYYGTYVTPSGTPAIMHSNYPTYFGDTASTYYPSFKLCVERLSSRQWFLISHGVNYPLAANGYTASRFVDWMNMPYDPTNGTASRGMIVRVGP